MAPEEVCRLLKERFGDAILDAAVEGGHPQSEVTPGRWPEVAQFLRDEPRLRLNLLRSITALDLIADDKLACVYDLQSVSLDRLGDLVRATTEFAVKVAVPRSAPRISTVSHVWPAADWHEREAYDLMGILFEGHPDLRRILCADDWEGHPLRKDYEFPMEYHGIPATTEYELPNPTH